MTKFVPKELREKAHWHMLSEEELAEVLLRLNTYLDDNNLCSTLDLDDLLEALGYTGAFTEVRQGFQKLVEKFLVFPSNPIISATALSILCNDWDLTSHYTNQIKSFIKAWNGMKDLMYN
jgi:hypothetical protein